jgi:hypothetical protein
MYELAGLTKILRERKCRSKVKAFGLVGYITAEEKKDISIEHFC